MGDRIKGFFDIDGPFYSFAKKLAYVFVINIMFVITCIPIFTVGASISAMHTIFLRIINELSFSLIKDYFRAFKENFIKSTVCWLIFLAVGFVFYIDIVYWVKFGLDDGVYGYIMLVVSVIAMAAMIMYAQTVFAMIPRFDLTLKEILTNSVSITISNIGYALEGLAFTVLFIGGTAFMVITGYIIFVYMLFLCFGLNGLVHSYIYRRVLNKYSEDYDEELQRQVEELEKEGYFDD